MTQTRFKPLSDDEMTPEQKAVAQTLLDGPRKGLPGPFHALLRSPDLADRVRALGDYVRFGNSLPATSRELVILLAARFWSAQYEWQAHRAIAIKAGLDPDIPAAIAEGRRPPKLSPDETLIYDFVHKLLHDKDVDDATYAAALERYGERTLLDIICIAGYFSFVSLILNAKRHPVPEGTVPLAPLRTA